MHKKHLEILFLFQLPYFLVRHCDYYFLLFVLVPLLLKGGYYLRVALGSWRIATMTKKGTCGRYS